MNNLKVSERQGAITTNLRHGKNLQFKNMANIKC